VAEQSIPGELRPFYFVLVVWGRQYRDYFLNYCLPSLLSPENIPSLKGRREMRYLIATTKEDWDAITSTVNFRELQRHAAVAFVQLPPCPPDLPFWRQNIVGHKLCCDIIFQERGYRIFTSPDAVFSDGAVRRMHELAARGVQAILKLTVPIVEENSFFNSLSEMQLLPPTAARLSGTPLVLSGRQMTSAALRSMHQMAVVNEWDAPHFCGYAAMPWWRVAGEDGIVACGLVWDILLMDYASIKTHDASLLDDRGWDGDYIMRTVGDLETIYLVRDSDEINAIGWSSNPKPPLRRLRGGELRKGLSFRTSYYNASFNSLHRRLLFFPTRMHSRPINAKWDAVEDEALRTLLTWVEPPASLGKLSTRLVPKINNYPEIDARVASCELPAWRRSTIVWAMCRYLLMPIMTFLARAESVRAQLYALLSKHRVLIRLIGLGVCGDESAVRWWCWRLRKLIANLRRLPFNEPRPELPK